MAGAIALAVVGGACGPSTPDAGGATTGTILVFGAASLTDAFGLIEIAFEAANPGADVVLNLAGSSTLREQVLAGAPGDVFASANAATVADLEAAGALSRPPVAFATNRLQIAVPPGNPAGVAGLADLADDALFVGLCAQGVPCGDLARETFARAGVVPAIDSNEPHVRALLTKVETGELDAAVTYVTDVAAAGDRVEGVPIPPDLNVTTTYPIAVLREAPNPLGAGAFVDFVTSSEARTILRDLGFGPP